MGFQFLKSFNFYASATKHLGLGVSVCRSVFRKIKATSCSIIRCSQTISDSVFGFLTQFYPIFFAITLFTVEIDDSKKCPKN